MFIQTAIFEARSFVFNKIVGCTFIFAIFCPLTTLGFCGGNTPSPKNPAQRQRLLFALRAQVTFSAYKTSKLTIVSKLTGYVYKSHFSSQLTGYKNALIYYQQLDGFVRMVLKSHLPAACL